MVENSKFSVKNTDAGIMSSKTELFLCDVHVFFFQLHLDTLHLNSTVRLFWDSFLFHTNSKQDNGLMVSPPPPPPKCCGKIGIMASEK